ncbi:MAG: PaaI family thioesterase [Paracoccaceae bacterium]
MIKDAQDFLAENFAPWVLALNPKVTHMTNTGATLEIPITPDIARNGNMVAGQTLSALADTAMVIACGAANGEMILVGTVTLETQFLRPATGEKIVAQAEITRMGRSMAFARARLIAQPSGKDVATASATFAK